MNARDVVLLSTADWDNPFWTNKQHVAVQLAERGFRVLYIDSLGLRRPSARAHDLARIVRRLRKAAARPQRVRDGLHVWSPIVMPFQRHGPVRAVNRAVLSTALRLATRSLGFESPLLWTYNPMTTRLLDVHQFDGIVYHSVDDIGAQPGMPGAVLEEAERDLARAADVIFATAPRLHDRLVRWNENTHVLPNVADYDHFSQALAADTALPADLAGIPGPRVGFVGAISGYKLDFALIRHVAVHRPDWSIVLIGRIGEGDPWTDAAQLEGLPNLHLLGPRPYDELPAYLKGLDVALLPSARNAYTASMFPMKFFEYLAAGRPVVSVDLPAIRAYHDAVHVASSPDAFVAAIAAALRGEGARLEDRLALASQHTWDARMRRMLSIAEHAFSRDGAHHNGNGGRGGDHTKSAAAANDAARSADAAA